MTEHTTKTMY